MHLEPFGNWLLWPWLWRQACGITSLLFSNTMRCNLTSWGGQVKESHCYVCADAAAEPGRLAARVAAGACMDGAREGLPTATHRLQLAGDGFLPLSVYP
jgi:hypothetical protein